MWVFGGGGWLGGGGGRSGVWGGHSSLTLSNTLLLNYFLRNFLRFSPGSGRNNCRRKGFNWVSKLFLYLFPQSFTTSCGIFVRLVPVGVPVRPSEGFGGDAAVGVGVQRVGVGQVLLFLLLLGLISSLSSTNPDIRLRAGTRFI